MCSPPRRSHIPILPIKIASESKLEKGHATNLLPSLTPLHSDKQAGKRVYDFKYGEENVNFHLSGTVLERSPDLCLERQVMGGGIPSTMYRSKFAIDPLLNVIIYEGHRKHPDFGPYGHSVDKRRIMFEKLNIYRRSKGLPPWNIYVVDGDQLIDVLKVLHFRSSSSLLVIPAGESTKLDKVFTLQQLQAIRSFFERGGKGYLTCGAAYWASKIRVFSFASETQPGSFEKIVKASKIPLFKGVAEGPLCPYPSTRYKAPYYTKAIRVTNGEKECTVYVGGGGSFILPESESTELTASWKEISRNPKMMGKGSFYNEKRKFPKSSSCTDLVTLHKACPETQFNVQPKGLSHKENVLLKHIASQEMPKQSFTHQSVHVLVRYKLDELRRLGFSAEEARDREIAAISVSVGKGKVVLAMFHPYYDSNDFDPELLDKIFPDSGTDWHQVKNRLSPEQDRIEFFHSTVINHLEALPL